MKIESEKLQLVSALVNQHQELLPPGMRINPAQQFKKLVIKRLFAENCLIFLLQFIGLKLTSLIGHPSPLWFATGTASAYLFLRGYSVLPGIWLGSYVSFYSEGIGFWLAFDWATMFALQGLLLLWFSYRYLSPTLIFSHLKTFMQFVGYCIILTGIVSFMFIGICSLSQFQAAVSLHLWLQWWLGNINGILIFACALITWDAYFPDFHATKLAKNTLFSFCLLFLLLITLAFCHTMLSTTWLLLSILLLNLFISARLGWCGAISVSFVSAIVLCLAAMVDAPVFYTYSASSTLLLIQLFLAMNAVLTLSLALSRKNIN